MIQSFRDAAAEQCFRLERVYGVGWEQAQRIVRRKLLMLDAAAALQELLSPPNNRLELLKGDRAGQYSIRVNDQWRVCFVWKDDGAHDVEIADYH
ncbi:MAG TPA: type II toxin-antitoxin system RelE/ParE family toxin [Acetobacteraceae bacterium]|jgi:toxin HigB-1|nr:type II toxin-antitoxin system RelE/ParE family toxin [Acetobacteraceae bacterium]